MDSDRVIATCGILVIVFISGGSCQGGVVDCVSGTNCDSLFNPFQLDFKSQFPFSSRPFPPFTFPPPTFKPSRPPRPPGPSRPPRPPRPPFPPFLGIPVQYPKDDETEVVEEEAGALINDDAEIEIDKTNALKESKKDGSRKAEELRVEEKSMEKANSPMSQLMRRSRDSNRHKRTRFVPLLRMISRFLQGGQTADQ